MDAAERDALVKAVRDGLAADVNSGRLAKDIAEEMTKRPAGVTGVLKNAGEAIGLIVGVVALAYVFGGVVIVLRLITDHSNAEQAVAVIGGLPRELVITLGFVEVLGIGRKAS
jgi:hypothetical protein